MGHRVSGCAILMWISKVASGGGRGCVTLMGPSEVRPDTEEWGGKSLCDFDGGF